MDNHSPSFLFHQPAFVFRNALENIIRFDSGSTGIYFNRLGNALVSMDKSPFGGFIFKSAPLASEITSLIKKAEEWCQANQVFRLIIRSFPDVYATEESLIIKDTLLDAGFTIKYTDITQLIAVRQGSNMLLDTHKRRRIRRARDTGFKFRRLSLDLLEESYSLVLESRTNKGYPITMTMVEIEKMFTLFPNDYYLFGIFDKNKMIATAVSIQVSPHILYCFYIGDHLAYRSYSPVTLLIDGIFKFCQTRLINLLDLGISTDKGIINEGLYTFKKKFGSFDSNKLTFEKQL